MTPDDPNKMLPDVVDDLEDESRTPLITESQVELYERVRKEQREPASSESREVGALNDLVAAVRAAASGCRAAAARASGETLSRELEEQGNDYDSLVARASRRVRLLGGAPPEQGDPEQLPRHPRDVEYAADDGSLHDWLEATRDYIAELCMRARELGFEC